MANSNPHRKSTKSSFTIHTMADKSRAMFKARYTKVRCWGIGKQGWQEDWGGKGQSWVSIAHGGNIFPRRLEQFFLSVLVEFFCFFCVRPWPLTDFGVRYKSDGPDTLKAFLRGRGDDVLWGSESAGCCVTIVESWRYGCKGAALAGAQQKKRMSRGVEGLDLTRQDMRSEDIVVRGLGGGK